MIINFILDKRIRDNEKPKGLEVTYCDEVPSVNIAQLIQLFNLEIFTIVDNSLRQGSTCKLTLIDKPMRRDVDSDYDGDIPILLHLPISVIIEKSVNLTEKDIDFLKRLLEESINKI